MTKLQLISSQVAVSIPTTWDDAKINARLVYGPNTSTAFTRSSTNMLYFSSFIFGSSSLIHDLSTDVPKYRQKEPLKKAQNNKIANIAKDMFTCEQQCLNHLILCSHTLKEFYFWRILGLWNIFEYLLGPFTILIDSDCILIIRLFVFMEFLISWALFC